MNMCVFFVCMFVCVTIWFMYVCECFCVCVCVYVYIYIQILNNIYYNICNLLRFSKNGIHCIDGASAL